MMGLAGLFLCVFLVVHLSINLLLLKNDGGVLYMQASGFMSSNMLIKIVEVFLFGGLLLHSLYGVILQIQNWIARPKGYMVAPNSQTSFFSKYMIHTGAIILAFLIFHLFHFFFVKWGISAAPLGKTSIESNHDFYHMVINLFSNPVYSWSYIAFILFLGFHLHHALQSAFRTIGVDHPVITPIIKAIGFIYSICITIGFIIIPVYFMYIF
jgi:succinate dehydrogenase / fumarate reductase, cytochrome b subunit